MDSAISCAWPLDFSEHFFLYNHCYKCLTWAIYFLCYQILSQSCQYERMGRVRYRGKKAFFSKLFTALFCKIFKRNTFRKRTKILKHFRLLVILRDFYLHFWQEQPLVGGLKICLLWKRQASGLRLSMALQCNA